MPGSRNPLPVERRRSKIRLPLPLWIGLALIVIVVAALGAISRVELQESNRQFYEELGRVNAGHQNSLYVYDTNGTDRLLKQLAQSSGIEEITIGLTDASDDGMRHVAELPNLRKLVIYGGNPGIGDRGFACFTKCTKLEAIKLINTNVTDAGLVILKELPNLRSLTLFREAVRKRTLTDAGLDHLRPLTHLESLHLTGGWASASAAEKLRHAMPHCIIETGDWSGVFDKPSGAQPKTSETSANNAIPK
jgi:hypothetical protein